MSVFEYKVKIEANSDSEAKLVLTAMFDLMKSARKEMTTTEFIEFAAKVKAKPSQIKVAKMFVK